MSRFGAYGRALLKANNRVSGLLTEPLPNLVPGFLQNAPGYDQVLGNPAGLGGAVHGLVDPLQSAFQHPSSQNLVKAAAVMPVPWGEGASGGRTGPAMPIQARMRQQALKDMWRDTSKSIQAAPELGAGTQWVQDSINELRMRELGLGKREIIQRRVDRNAGRRATLDQLTESARGLESLLPDPAIVPNLPANVKAHLVETLMKTRKQVEEAMLQQQKGNARGMNRLPEELLFSAPQRIETTRNQVEAILSQHLGNVLQESHTGNRIVAQQKAAQAQALQDAMTRLMTERPGAQLDYQHYGIH